MTKPYLYNMCAFGPNQFSYIEEFGARDAVFLFVTSTLLTFRDGCKIGLYCSNVAGAFDQVDMDRLVANLPCPKPGHRGRHGATPNG